MHQPLFYISVLVRRCIFYDLATLTLDPTDADFDTTVAGKIESVDFYYAGDSADDEFD